MAMPARPGAHTIDMPYRHHCAACCLDILYRAMAMPARPGAHAIYIPYRHQSVCCLLLGYTIPRHGHAGPGAHAIYIPYRHHCAACCLDILYYTAPWPCRPGPGPIPYIYHTGIIVYTIPVIPASLRHHMPSVPELLFGLPRGFSGAVPGHRRHGGLRTVHAHKKN